MEYQNSAWGEYLRREREREREREGKGVNFHLRKRGKRN